MIGTLDTEPLRVTPKEREVVLLAANGLTSQQIGRKLGISRRTVSSHLNNVYQKNNVASRVALTRRLLLAGMIVPQARVEYVDEAGLVVAGRPRPPQDGGAG